ncbi:MAG: Flp pilus assembly protein CpaB [Clostridiaceae bacterium]
MKKRVIAFAVILGLITVGALYFYLESLKVIPEKKVELTEVIVALSNIPSHVKVTNEMVALKSLPIEAVHPDSAKSLEEVVGFTTKSEIINGEQILGSRIASENDQTSLSYRIPENMRAMTIPINEISGVGGYIEKGDLLDIVVTYNDKVISPNLMTVTLFQNIEILEKGPIVIMTEGEAPNPGVTTSLTLLVTPSQAEVIAYSIVNGSMQLTLRNPIDSKINVLTQFRTEEFATWRER